MKKTMTILTLCMAAILLCGCLVGCDLSEIFGQGAGEGDSEEKFVDLNEKDTFEDGKPYHLYFLSNGDGTCSLRYITTDPENEQDYVIEIPETSPAGDTVTAIKIEQIAAPVSSIADFPVVLTASAMKELCQKAQESSMPNFDYNKFTAYFFKISVESIDDAATREELINAYPVSVYSDVYVFDRNASETERTKIYSYLTQYCGWDAAQYRQSVDEIIALAKQCNTREQAELCMTVMRNATFEHASGMTIPKTVASIDVSLWADMPDLQSVTVADENPTIKLIDDCLIDTATGTLELCLAKDGKIPEDAGIRILDDYAFARCVPAYATEGLNLFFYLSIPQGVTEIKEGCFERIFSEWDNVALYIYLPTSLRVFGRNPKYPIYYYAGTTQEWNDNLTFVGMTKYDYIYLCPADAQQAFKVTFEK